MLQIDSISNLALSVDDVCSMDTSRVSSAKVFREFAKGISVPKGFLWNDRWQYLGNFQKPSAVFNCVMHEMLTLAYDTNRLESMGGHVGIRVTGVGEYMLVALNGRVVTFSGLPVDQVTGEEVCDIEIAPDVFLAFCRGVLLDVAGELLEQDDEYEFREISAGELALNGMPVGGLATREVSDFGASLSAARSGGIGTLDASGVGVGRIDRSGDQDWFAVQLTAGRSYTIELKGAPSGRGTLADPYLKGIYDANGAIVHSGNDDSGGLESRISFVPTGTGTYYIAAGAFGSHTGTYQISIPSAQLSSGGGGQSASSNILFSCPANISTTWVASEEGGADFGSSPGAGRLGIVGSDGIGRGSINGSGDQDWFMVQLTAGQSYRIELKGAPSGRGTLADPYLRGIYDGNGALIHSGNDDSGGLESQIHFIPSATGTYFVSAGAYGGHTGSYQLSVSQTPIAAIASGGCAAAVAVCGADRSVFPDAHCYADAGGCGANAAAGESDGCYANASGCGARALGSGAWSCGTNATGCGARALASGAGTCGANITGCGVDVGGYGATGCPANASGCGARAAACGIDGCGANASACGARAGACGADGCGANASVCGARGSVIGCGAYSVACGVDASGGVDGGVCAINILPVLPSC